MSDQRVQVSLASGPSRLTCWVEPKGVTVGRYITLKDSDNPSQWWMVLSMSEPKSLKDINTNRTWKVGGVNA